MIEAPSSWGEALGRGICFAAALSADLVGSKGGPASLAVFASPQKPS
jgi:hypothetical protein